MVKIIIKLNHVARDKCVFRVVNRVNTQWVRIQRYKPNFNYFGYSRKSKLTKIQKLTKFGQVKKKPMLTFLLIPELFKI